MLAQDASMQEQLSLLQSQFRAFPEWLLNVSETNGFAVQASEVEITIERNDKLVLSCPTARGWQNWTILGWEKSGDKLIIRTARKLSSIAATLEFTPRVSVQNLQADVKAARLQAAHELARLAQKTFSSRAKIERVSLNQSNRRGKIGTIAKILLALPNGKTIAVCGSIIEKIDPANLLATAILWLTRLEERRTFSKLWLVAEGKTVADLQNLHALLRTAWREKIEIYSRQNLQDKTHGEEKLEFIEPLSQSNLCLKKPKKLLRPAPAELSGTAQTIIELAPAMIDVVRSKQGETLRFNGLPFVRIRQVLGEEQVWFGVNAKPKRILDETNLEEFSDLLENLREHRSFEAIDKRNALYKAAPEAWLEAILRRDVSRLDPNLILAPVYAQFRLSNKKGALDLLALRRDGRLVVIELKATIDREHVFQAANYWQQIEAHRRSGNFKHSNLFGDLPILDAPPLVYLVAPLMSFHRDFEVLANAMMPEIEIWRFDLNEDWRGGIRVARCQTNSSAKQI